MYPPRETLGIVHVFMASQAAVQHLTQQIGPSQLRVLSSRVGPSVTIFQLIANRADLHCLTRGVYSNTADAADATDAELSRFGALPEGAPHRIITVEGSVRWTVPVAKFGPARRRRYVGHQQHAAWRTPQLRGEVVRDKTAAFYQTKPRKMLITQQVWYNRGLNLGLVCRKFTFIL